MLGNDLQVRTSPEANIIRLISRTPGAGSANTEYATVASLTLKEALQLSTELAQAVTAAEEAQMIEVYPNETLSLAELKRRTTHYLKTLKKIGITHVDLVDKDS